MRQEWTPRREKNRLENKANFTRKYSERRGVGMPTKRLNLAKTYQGGWNCFFFFPTWTAYFCHMSYVVPIASSARGGKCCCLAADPLL